MPEVDRNGQRTQYLSSKAKTTTAPNDNTKTEPAIENEPNMRLRIANMKTPTIKIPQTICVIRTR